MACGCGRVGEIARGNEILCRLCFIKRFEKRVKKALRQRRIKKGERVLVVGAVAAHLFKKFVHVPLDVKYSPALKEGFAVAVVEWTLDDECVAFLEAFAGGTFEHHSAIPLFQFVSDEDVELYAKMKKLHFVPKKKSQHWHEFLAHFDLDMKYNLLRSAREIQELINALDSSE